MKQGLFGTFLGISVLAFPETWHGVRSSYGVERDRAIFWKNSLEAKITENGQKWPKNRAFGPFKKTMSLV